MSVEAVMEVRSRVREVVAHLRVAEVYPLGSKSRDLHDRYAPTLRRFAAGEDDSMDQVHLALGAMESAAVATSNQTLYAKASWAANCALPLCSASYQELVRRSFMDLMRSMGVRTSEDGR